jgi:hypothetical protein
MLSPLDLGFIMVLVLLLICLGIAYVQLSRERQICEPLIRTLTGVHGGIYKRVDENRELFGLLFRDFPEVLRRKPYITPELFRVELNQEQAILSACSLSSNSGSNGGGTHCRPLICKRANGAGGGGRRCSRLVVVPVPIDSAAQYKHFPTSCLAV